MILLSDKAKQCLVLCTPSEEEYYITATTNKTASLTITLTNGKYIWTVVYFCPLFNNLVQIDNGDGKLLTL